MAAATLQFEHVAETLSERTAEMLGARVYVTDAHGTVIASSEPGAERLPLHLDGDDADACLRVPLRVGGHAGEVVVAGPSSGENIPQRLARTIVELVINQAVMLTQLPNQHTLKNDFVHGLLRGTITDETSAVREGQILGMDLTLPRAVILIDAAGYVLAPATHDAIQPELGEAYIQQRARLIIASVVSYFQLPSDTICAYIGNGEIAVLKASSTHDLVAWSDGEDGMDQWTPSWANLTALKRAARGLLARLRRDTGAPISIGIGRYHPGIRGLARSYQDALAALSLGRRFHGTNRIHCLDQLGVASFVGVSDERTKIDLASHLLSPLDHEPELLDTLDAFFVEDCCPSSTATRLSIHRNTLGYRLDKITALTGLDPRRFDDAIQIRLALLLRTLRGDALPGSAA